MRKILIAMMLTSGMAGPALAGDWALYPVEGSFEDAVFDLTTTIEGRGLVIDSVSHVGEMLARTRADVGSDVKLFENADVFLFCSAAISRRVMEADPMNIAHCPYSIFLIQKAGSDQVEVGYRHMPEGPMQEVEALLKGIVEEVAE